MKLHRSRALLAERSRARRHVTTVRVANSLPDWVTIRSVMDIFLVQSSQALYRISIFSTSQAQAFLFAKLWQGPRAPGFPASLCGWWRHTTQRNDNTIERGSRHDRKAPLLCTSSKTPSSDSRKATIERNVPARSAVSPGASSCLRQ